MKHVTDKIRRIISGNANTMIKRKSHPFDFIQTRKGILRELMISKESGDLIGLVSPALGEGIFLVLVVYIESQNAEEMISFQKYDVSDGRTSLTAKLPVRDIKGICPFVHSERSRTHVV